VTDPSGPSGPRPLEQGVAGGPTVVELRELAQAIGVSTPWFDDEAEKLLDHAQTQVEVACGQRFTPDSFAALTDEQQRALAQAIVLQSVWLAELEDAVVGPSDISGLPEGISFSTRERPRLSPAVLEVLALRDLIVRTGMARPPIGPDPEPDPAPVMP
jgi:hypothetical protein